MSHYLDLVEEFPKFPEYTQFEKILVAARRAKDIHDRGKMTVVEDVHHSAAYTALSELNAQRLDMVYREEEPPPLIASDDDGDGDDEE